eukprot:UN05189
MNIYDSQQNNTDDITRPMRIVAMNSTEDLLHPSTNSDIMITHHKHDHHLISDNQNNKNNINNTNNEITNQSILEEMKYSIAQANLQQQSTHGLEDNNNIEDDSDLPPGLTAHQKAVFRALQKRRKQIT